MIECELCLEEFSNDFFQFFSCAHKTCSFCYIKLIEINKSNIINCPFCRTINNNHNEFIINTTKTHYNYIEENEYNEYNEHNEYNEYNEYLTYHDEYNYHEQLCKKFIKTKNKKIKEKNKRKTILS